MPYHEQRLPPDMKRADYMVSPNIGRTVHATRQAVLEVRQLVTWLKEQGYERIAVVGTSIGSCVTYLAFVHDPSICTAVFNPRLILFCRRGLDRPFHSIHPLGLGRPHFPEGPAAMLGTHQSLVFY